VPSRCLPVPDKGRLEEDLRGVNRLIHSGISLIRAEQLPPGSPVDIVRGPLAGLRGRVVGKGRKVSFDDEVAFLHQGARVEFAA
jgi:hypothetical protein